MKKPQIKEVVVSSYDRAKEELSEDGEKQDNEEKITIPIRTKKVEEYTEEDLEHNRRIKQQ